MIISTQEWKNGDQDHLIINQNYLFFKLIIFFLLMVMAHNTKLVFEKPHPLHFANVWGIILKKIPSTFLITLNRLVENLLISR